MFPVGIERSFCQVRLSLVAGLLLVLIAPLRVGAHADMLLQIDEVSKEIAKAPANADLYLRRSQLYREHAEYGTSYVDVEKAFSLNPQLPTIDLIRGRLFLDWGWPLSARACLDRFLARQPKYVDALVLRARALSRMNQRRAAVVDYDLALKLSTEPGPDLFVERAQLLMTEDREQWAEAVRGLDDGLQRLGPLVTLQLFAIDAELKLKNYDGALARVDKVAERSPRKETWLSRRGEILVQAGRSDEARRAYESALAALQTLPPTRRNVPAMQELSKRIQKQIETLRAGTSSAAGGGIVNPLKP
jgi:tetratricopeptide (TPR) repeat protein